MHDVIRKDHRRHNRKKKFFIDRIVSYHERFKQEYQRFKSDLQKYNTNRSDVNKSTLEESVQRFGGHIQTFVYESTEDIKPILDILDNPRLIDKFVLIITDRGSGLKAIGQSVLNAHHSNMDLVNAVGEMDDMMKDIDNFVSDLKEEVVIS
jgi:hypothetical protein